LLAIALAPAAAFAQQGKTQPEATPAKTEAKTEASEKQPEATEVSAKEDPKLQSVPGSKALGMSILGNQEAPKALVLVPWKRSELGSVLDISTMLDDSRLPIDKEVFMRMLSYYQIRSGTANAATAPTKGNTEPIATAADRRKP
jgi:hypothetical protein